MEKTMNRKCTMIKVWRDEKTGEWYEEPVEARPLYTTYDDNDPNFPEEKKMIMIKA